MSRGITRKELFRNLLGAVREAGGRAAARPVLRQERLLRPPGARLPDADYLAACTGCEKCVAVCPAEALLMATVDGEPPRRVAVLAPERRPCTLCSEVPCSRVCEPGALQPLQRPLEVRIGVAQVDPLLCRTFRGQSCDSCVRICPFPGEAIRQVNGRPLVVSQSCTGCGLCVRACPEEPKAITVIPERDLIPGVRMPLVPPRSARYR